MTAIDPRLTESADLLEGPSTLWVGRTLYAIERREGTGPHGVWYVLTGPRGATYGLLPHVTQRTPGILTLMVLSSSWRVPTWAQGLVFVAKDDGRTVGWFR